MTSWHGLNNVTCTETVKQPELQSCAQWFCLGMSGIQSVSIVKGDRCYMVTSCIYTIMNASQFLK